MKDQFNGNGHVIRNRADQSPALLPEPYNSVPNSPSAIDLIEETEDSRVTISHYLWILRRYRWKIIALILTCVIATVIISVRLTPIYESTATIDVDRRMPTGILGQEAMQSSTNDADQFLATQINLIQSDSVLRPVVHRYGLEKEYRESIRSALTPAEAEEAPVKLRHLRVTRPPNTYLLLVSYQSSNRRLAADVANGIAQSYLEHTYRIRFKASSDLSQFMERQLEELRAKMERSSAALVQFERELNVINPEEKTNILSARLLQLNAEFTAAQAERVKKQAAHASVGSGAGEAAQVSSQGDALRKLSEGLNEAKQKLATVSTHYGVNHPEYKRSLAVVQELERQIQATRESIGQRVEIEYKQALDREQMLEKAVTETKSEYDRLNARSFEYQTVKREAEADKKLYEELVRRIKEAGINASFQNSSIRVADPARPGLKPVFPNLKLNVLLALLFSMLAAFGCALMGDILDNTIRDPEQVMRTLRTEVVGNLPQVKTWRGQVTRVNVEGASGIATSTADRALSSYEEAIRTLRNSILLMDTDRQFRTFLVTSASPSEGKSTIAIHLGIAHAQQNHRTIVVDGDLRRPSIHKRFSLPNQCGLSNVLRRESSWRDAVLHPPDIPGLAVLPAGTTARRAADLIGQGLDELLTELCAEYDLVILDAPPLLGFPEPLRMAAAVDGVIVVARAGQTSRKGVANVLSTLKRLRANVIGLVLNEVHREISDTYYYYGYYGKYYKHYNGSATK